MAKRQYVNIGQQNGVSGLLSSGQTTISATGSPTGGNNLTGNGQDCFEFATADACVLYINTLTATGTTPSLALTLSERDPNSGLYVPVPGLTITAITATSTLPARYVIDPLYGDCYRLSWVATGTTPVFVIQALAILTTRL